MTVEERQKLSEERRLIFVNLANGVPKSKVMAAFRRSETEIDREFDFVCRKIREYRFRRQLPPLACETDKDLRWNRRALLDTLSKLGPEYLASELLLPKIAVHAVKTPEDLQEASRRVGARQAA